MQTIPIKKYDSSKTNKGWYIIGETEITDNMWFQQGHNIGDILFFENDHRFSFEKISNYFMLTFPDGSILSVVNTWCLGGEVLRPERFWHHTDINYLKFNLKEYIEDINNPSETELALFKLQFPEEISEVLLSILNNLEE